MEQVRGSSQHRAAADPPQMCLPPRTAPEALRRGSASSGRPSSCRPPSASPASSTSEIDPTPLDNAVTSAIDHSDISAQVNPQLVALVTHQVIHSLKAQGFGAGGSSSASSSSPADAHAGVPAPPRDVITPPSPTRPGDHPNRGPPPPRLDDHLDGITDGRNPIEKHSAQDPNLDQTRPSMTSRQLTGNATILEKIWQPLFDADGMPTSRLSQFLRGLAVHIIEDFEPASSLVVTPPKMQQFYNETAVPGEIYPWHTLFGGKVTNSSLSHLYRDLKCEHFFVQRAGAFDEKPAIPALTPLGFETWFIHAIRSHPDLEWQRFSKAVLAMPISNFSDRKERFPKELPRRLFPAATDERARIYFEDSILADEAIDLLPHLSHTTSAPAGPMPATAKPRTKTAAFAEPPTYHDPPPSSDHHHRRGTAASESATEASRGSVTIERERKPYTAQPGQGKHHDLGDTSRTGPRESRPRRSTTAESRPAFDAADYGTGRSKSRSGSVSAANHYADRRHGRSPSKNGRGGGHDRSDEPVAGGGASTSQGDDDEVRRRIREARASQAREYVMEETSRGHAAADDEYLRRRRSLGAGSGYPAAPPPSRYS